MEGPLIQKRTHEALFPVHCLSFYALGAESTGTCFRNCFSDQTFPSKLRNRARSFSQVMHYQKYTFSIDAFHISFEDVGGFYHSIVNFIQWLLLFIAPMCQAE